MEDVKQTSEQYAQDRNEGLTTAELAGPRPATEVRRVPKERAAPTGDGADSVPSSNPAEAPVTGQQAAPLLSTDESNHLRGAWDSIQAGFVDEPRHAVEQADNLVADTMKRLAEMFTAERSKLEGQWDRGGDVSTEDLRLALHRYRSFFHRLLSI